jgi:hypothetical protein
MSYKIVKFVSNQSGPFTKSANTVDLELPAYVGYCDMMRTSIVINMKLIVANGDPLGLYNAGFNDGLDATCLIKNCSISTNKSGVIEQIPQPNILYSNLSQTQRDFEDDNGMGVFGFGTVVNHPTDDPGDDLLSTFIRKVKDGTRLSTQETYLKIPLAKLFGCCNMKQFPNNLFGNIKISLEFEDDPKILQCLFKQTVTNEIGLGDANTAAQSSFFYLPIGTPLQYHVGQSITVTTTTDAGGQAGDITDITYNSGNNKHMITANFGTPPTFAGTNTDVLKPNASGTNDVDLRYSIRDVELEVYQWNLTSQQENSLNSKMKKGVAMDFTTYSLERINMPAITTNSTYVKQFDIEPSTINCFMMFMKYYDAQEDVNAGSNTQHLFSTPDGLNSYRWRLNMIDTTSRDVVPHQSLYNDRLMTTLNNGRMRIKNLRLTNGARLDTDESIKSAKNKPGISTFIIPTPIPKREVSQVIQIRINQERAAVGAAPKILYLWKQVEKSISLKSSGIEVM